MAFFMQRPWSTPGYPRSYWTPVEAADYWQHPHPSRYDQQPFSWNGYDGSLQMPTVKFTVRPRSTGRPTEPTGCPRVPTGCPTGCPKGPTGCPKIPTTYPRGPKRCPSGPTECPRRATGCPKGPSSMRRPCPDKPTGSPRGWFGRHSQTNGDQSRPFSGHPIEFLLAHLLSGGEESEMRKCPKTSEKSPCDKKPACFKEEKSTKEQSKKTSDETEKATDEAASNGADIQSMDELVQHFFSVMLGGQEDRCCNPGQECDGKEANDQTKDDIGTGKQETEEKDTEKQDEDSNDQETKEKDVNATRNTELMVMTPMGPLEIVGQTEIAESDSEESDCEYVCHLEDPTAPEIISQDQADAIQDVDATEDQTNNQVILREDQGFLVNFNLDGFEPEDINVKLAGDKLEVNAHRVAMDDGIKIQKDFFRIISLPTNVDADTLKCEFTDDGLMTLSADNKVAPKEKILTVQRVQNNVDMLD